MYELLAFKRKQIIRDQNWFRTECELPQEIYFKERPLMGFHENHTFTFLTRKIYRMFLIYHENLYNY